jgi:hypothetical protein
MSRDEPELDSPIDLDAVAPGLQSEDSLGQDTLARALFQCNTTPSEESDAYQKLRISAIPLSRYKNEFERGGARFAMSLLQSRCKVEIDKEFRVSANDDLLTFACNNHFLDYFMVSSEELGLWAAIPTVPSDLTFVVELDFRQPFREFKGKHARLSYDPMGRFLWVGRVRDEDLFVAMCPVADCEGLVVKSTAPGRCTGDNRLRGKHYRMLTMFFASALALIPGKAFHCEDPYEIDISEAEQPAFSLHTNIL